MKMKASNLKDATAAVAAVPPTSEVQADTTGKLYFFPNDHATAASNVYRARWDHSEHIEEFHMLAKLKALSTDDKTQVKILVNGLYEKEMEARKLREFGQSRRVLKQLWDNPEDAEYNQL